uniref:Calponin-homology (CH) domain-containing protein n=2 Tax=Ascaris TaxID=6251 RepID=A0A0M3I857_ASCLU
MRRIFGDDNKVTTRSNRSSRSNASTSVIRPPLRPPLGPRSEVSRVGSASHRRSLLRNAEERSRRIVEIRKHFDSQNTCSSSSTSKCVDVKRLKTMGGVVSLSRNKLLGRRQLRDSADPKRTVVLRDADAVVENGRDLRHQMHQMMEKYDSASEELEANEQELTELREALNVARRGSSVLSAQNLSYVERVESLTAELEESRKRELQLRTQVDNLAGLLKRKTLAECGNIETRRHDDMNENCEVQKLTEENERLRARISELNGEKLTLKEALRKAKEEKERLADELIQLSSSIEVEREEWDRMQADLLVAVRVANDFKVEAQEEMKGLYAKIADLQRRRQSGSGNISLGSVKAIDDPQQSWEDVAWQRLMRRCGRGSRRNALLRWCQQAISTYPNVDVTNFSSSWADGKALCYLLASFYPEKIDAECISSLSAEECVKMALDVGTRIGVKAQLSADVVLCDDRPDWSLVMKYILYIYYLVSARE